MSIWYQASLYFCGLIALVGVFGLLLPSALKAFSLRMITNTGLILAGVLRIAFGACLFLAAPETNWPEVLKPLGVLLIAVGALSPLIGTERIGGLVNRLMEDNSLIRMVSMAAIGIAAFIFSLLRETI